MHAAMHNVRCLSACNVVSPTKHCNAVLQPLTCRPVVPPPQRGRSFTRQSVNKHVCAAQTQPTITSSQMNEVSNTALLAMLSHDRQQARQAEAELQKMMLTLANDQDKQGVQYVSVLQGLLNHTVIDEAEELDGMYKQAFDRILNQVAGSEWKLSVKGQSAEANSQEPKYSTWEEAFGKKKQASSSSRSASSNEQPRDSAPPRPSAGQNGVVDDLFYRLLGVSPAASQADIKSAYRKAALKVHPDVSDAPDATEKFSQLSSAYDTLSDPTARQLYNKFGAEGMKQHSGAQAGQGNARDAWDEFKPFKKENKRTRARAAATASVSVDDSSKATEADAGLPVMGDIVEYPLSDVVKQELQDGRSHGVGLLVGRNKDRGDAKTLPVQALGLCEVEPLRQEEAGSDRWIPDELGVSSFAQLDDLKTIPVTSFDARFDVWHVEAPLSEGCGGPELPEEIML